MRVLWKVYLDQCENVRDHHRLDDTWAGLERSWRSMCGAGVQCSGRGKAETVAQKLELAAWAGSSRNEGGRRKASSEGSAEWVLGVSAVLTLTFQSLIGFLAILWSGCGNLWGWRKAECFYPCVVFFPFDESPDMWNPPPFPVLLSNLILAFKMGSKKKREEKGNWFVCFSHFLGNTLSFYSGVTAKETLPVIRSVRQWLCYTRYLGK